MLVLKTFLQFHQFVDVDLLPLLQLLVGLPQSVDLSGFGLLHAESGLGRGVALFQGRLFGLDGIVGVVAVEHVGAGGGLLSNHIRY